MLYEKIRKKLYVRFNFMEHYRYEAQKGCPVVYKYEKNYLYKIN